MNTKLIADEIAMPTTAGTASSITGTSVSYSGGGGAGAYAGSTATTATAGGGSGGVASVSVIAAVAGQVNTGGGGGGGGDNTGVSGDSKNGGSGIVIIAFPDTFRAATLVNLTYTEPTRAGFRVYQITASSSGTITF